MLFRNFISLSKNISMLLLGLTLANTACTQSAKTTEKKKINAEVAVIETDFGNIILKFYDKEAPKHTENFKKLARAGFYDTLTFHRVIPGFMIQAGDPNSKDNDPYNDGRGGPGYTVPAEFNKKRFHKRGALAAARQADQVNPRKESSGSQFYIVQNGPVSLDVLKQMEAQFKAAKPGFYFTNEQIDTYTTLGGTPFLDGEYTVYGEVVSGLDVIDKIAMVQTDPRNNRPVQNVIMKKVSIQTMEIEE